MEHECLICKRHYTQGGTCCANKKNCLLFEKEEKGKMIHGTFCIEINHNAVIRKGEHVVRIRKTVFCLKKKKKGK